MDVFLAYDDPILWCRWHFSIKGLTRLVALVSKLRQNRLFYSIIFFQVIFMEQYLPSNMPWIIDTAFKLCR